MPIARFLTQPQLDGSLCDIQTPRLAKLERIDAVEMLESNFRRPQVETDDRRNA
jgi:hypothetical protein